MLWNEAPKGHTTHSINHPPTKANFTYFEKYQNMLELTKYKKRTIFKEFNR